jgi:hypothetical protein
VAFTEIMFVLDFNEILPAVLDVKHVDGWAYMTSRTCMFALTLYEELISKVNLQN